ncbi:hypothetical protein Trydic_g16680 [Trypoxylus dichotomus]
MQEVFIAVINEGITLSYMDDLITLAVNQEDTSRRLNVVFKAFSEHGLEINFKKCQLLQGNLEFVDVHPSPEKPKVVLCFPKPIIQKQLPGFLCLGGYFGKCISKYSITERPLSDLLKRIRPSNLWS